MILTAHRLLRAVRARLGVDPDPSPLESDECSCTSLTAQIILDTIASAAADAMAVADTSLMLDVVQPLPDEIQWTRLGRRRYGGCVALPMHTIRVLSLRMSDWRRPATDITDADTPRARLAALRHPAFAGNPARPVSRIERTPCGMRLHFAACVSPHSQVAEGGYIVLPRFDPEGGINLPERLVAGIIEAAVKDLGFRIQDSGFRI